jgi:hypothetical protein
MKMGVEKVQLALHTHMIAAETLPPPEAIALTMTSNRSDCDRQTSWWDLVMSMMEVMEMVRMTVCQLRMATAPVIELT